jgi:TPP-dependent 2-oxoacid decarboxylase
VSVLHECEFQCSALTIFICRQMSVQELSVMIRVGVKPIIFVLNNKGYTIERVLHSADRKYHDIPDW